ncbi:MAG: hypothetical protein FWG80_01525 [Alphaproteobacteria bacterium]|nr:hypothetical protein [Alphaproteobacteria bacterium]
MPTKKIVKKTKTAVKKTAPKTIATPVATACSHDTGCACKAKGRGLKKILWLIVVFALGFAAGKFCVSQKHGWKHHMRWSFTNGCLDTSKIKRPMLAQKILGADVNNDGCITKAELKEWKKTQFADKGTKKNKKCDCKKCKHPIFTIE